jgi:hypothetical protein
MQLSVDDVQRARLLRQTAVLTRSDPRPSAQDRGASSSLRGDDDYQLSWDSAEWVEREPDWPNAAPR